MAKLHWIVSGLMAAVCITYSYLMVTDPDVRPSAATWLIFVIATGMVVASYRKAGQGDAERGALILADAASTWIIFAMVVISSGLELHFQPFDRWYLAGALLIGIFWLITRKHLLSNLLVQGLIAIGYLPTLHKLIIDQKNSEPLSTWTLSLAASILGAVLAAKPHDGSSETRADRILSMVYAWRSIVCVSAVLLLAIAYS